MGKYEVTAGQYAALPNIVAATDSYGSFKCEISALRTKVVDQETVRAIRPDYVTKRFRLIYKDAGLEHCTFHDLRKTFFTDLARAGVSQVVVQRLAGHASSATTAKHSARAEAPQTATKRAFGRVGSDPRAHQLCAYCAHGSRERAKTGVLD